MPEAVQQLSPEMRLARERTWKAAQAMVYRLAETGSGLFDETVLEFQTAWNSYRSFIAVALRGPADSCKPGVAMDSLVEDGMYGPQTSTGLYLFAAGSMGSVPPCRASGMPTWFAQNRNYVDSWVSPSETTDNVEIVGPTEAAQTELREVAPTSTPSITEPEVATLDNRVVEEPTPAEVIPADVAVAPAGPTSLCELLPAPQSGECADAGFGSWVRNELRAGKSVFFSPATAAVGTRERTVGRDFDLCSAFDPAARERCQQGGFENFVRDELSAGYAITLHPPALEAGAMVQAPSQIPQEVPGPLPTPEEVPLPPEIVGEDLPVLTAPRTGAVPVVAVGVGALALGGVLWAFTRRPRRRRARS